MRECLWEAADQSNWQRFVELLGGPNAKRKECPIRLAHVWSDKANRYQESKGYQLYGIEYKNVTIPTRIQQWTIEYRAKQSRPDVVEARREKNDLLKGLPIEKTTLAPLEFCK